MTDKKFKNESFITLLILVNNVKNIIELKLYFYVTTSITIIFNSLMKLPLVKYALIMVREYNMDINTINV